MAISLDKIPSLSLRKTAEVAAEVIDKSKLNGQTAKVAVVLDFSASMRGDYRSGSMQRLTEKVLALGTQFDDDGAIDFFVFDSGAAHLGEVTVDDFTGSVDRLTNRRQMGSTNYAAAFRKVRDHFAPKKSIFGRKKGSDLPVYALFLTDGDPDSQTDAEAALREVSAAPIFWKFLSIGPRKMANLQTLDDLPGRVIDNADYQHVGHVDGLSDVQLFDKMLEEFPEFLASARAKGLIR